MGYTLQEPTDFGKPAPYLGVEGCQNRVQFCVDFTQKGRIGRGAHRAAHGCAFAVFAERRLARCAAFIPAKTVAAKHRLLAIRAERDLTVIGTFCANGIIQHGCIAFAIASKRRFSSEFLASAEPAAAWTGASKFLPSLGWFVHKETSIHVLGIFDKGARFWPFLLLFLAEGEVEAGVR
jgi:hypothetical protein